MEPKLPTGISMGTYYCLSDLTGEEGTVSKIVRALTKIKRSELIRILVLILIELNKPEALKIDYQLRLAKDMLEPDLIKRLVKHVRTPGILPGCIFLHRQVYFLLQLVVLASNEDGEKPDDLQLRHTVGRSCLMVNDILHVIEPKDTPRAGTKEFTKWFAATLIPVYQRRQGFEVLARARDFWFEIPALPNVRKKLEKISGTSLAEAFQQRHDIALREYYLIMIALYVHYLEHGEAAATLLDQARYLTPAFRQDDVERAMKTISQAPDQLANHLLGSQRQNWAFDHTPLRRFPLVEVFDGQHACIDQSLFLRSITDKIVFMLQDSYGSEIFNRMFGIIFEEYIFSLLSESVAALADDGRVFFPNPRFEGKEDEVCDALLLKDGTAIVIECKARLLTTLEKFGGQKSKTLTGVDHILAKFDSKSKKGVPQIANNLPRLLNGEKVASGPGGAFSISDCHTFIPVIVTFEESIGFEAVRQIAEWKFSELLSRGAAASRVRVGPLIVLTVRDIELLEAYAGAQSPITIVAEYASYRSLNPNDMAGDFSDFIAIRGFSYDSDVRLSLTDTKMRSAMEEATAELGSRASEE